MKHSIGAIAAIVCASAFGQGPQPMPGPSIGSADRALLISADQMPVPPPPSELRKLETSSPLKAQDGFSTVTDAPDHVRQFMNELELVKGMPSSPTDAHLYSSTPKFGKAMPSAPLVVKRLEDLRLGLTTAAVRTGKLIGAAPQGTVVNGKWTGVERYFHIEGGGYSRVSETDLAATGGMFYMNKAAVNTTVAGKPAISILMTNKEGQRVEEVLWVSGSKLYKVTYAPEQQIGRHGPMKLNPSISAVSLATELR